MLSEIVCAITLQFIIHLISGKSRQVIIYFDSILTLTVSIAFFDAVPVPGKVNACICII